MKNDFPDHCDWVLASLGSQRNDPCMRYNLLDLHSNQFQEAGDEELKAIQSIDPRMIYARMIYREHQRIVEFEKNMPKPRREAA